MLLHDPYALHRKWWDADWVPGVNDKDWVRWDYILADVWQLICDFTDADSGQWMPFDQNGDTDWIVKSKFSGSIAAIDRERESRKGELEDGESLYAVPVFRDPQNKPTLSSWAIDINEDKADLRPTDHRDGRPPTPDELKALGL